MFTTHTGSFETNDLEIHCEDLFPMDLGNTGFTEFYMNEEVTAYMAENIELFDCDLGLIHSHHTMGAFFSGQDIETLQLEGNDTNCFISLIVDTRGTYQAAITRKIQVKSEVTVKPVGSSYEFFGEGPVPVKEEEERETKVYPLSKDVIEYFMLNVEVETVSNPLEYLDSRFDQIDARKRRQVAQTPAITPPNIFINNDDDDDANNYRQPWDSVDDDEPYTQEGYNQGSNAITAELEKQSQQASAALMGFKPDAKLIEDTVKRMIIMSMASNIDGLNLKSWIEKRMVGVYDKAFKNPGIEDVTGIDPFESWCDFIIEFSIMNFNDPSISTEEIAQDYDFYGSTVAKAIHDYLKQYEGSNKYIDEYLKSLNRYFVE